MANLTNQQKKEWAKLLFIQERLTQVEIAAKTGVSKTTICKWAKDEDWERLRASVTITREEQIGNLYRQLEELNNDILSRDPGKRVANAKEADTINKLACAIDKMEKELGISDIISVSKKFIQWVRVLDPNKAMEITPLFDNFIKSQIR